MPVWLYTFRLSAFLASAIAAVPTSPVLRLKERRMPVGEPCNAHHNATARRECERVALPGTTLAAQAELRWLLRWLRR